MKNTYLIVVLATIVGAIWYLESLQPEHVQVDPNAQNVQIPASARNEEKVARYPLAKELVNPDGYLNLSDGAKSITMRELVGKKVILIDFWTYSCINCQRTLPYLNAWYEKYKDQGLEIIGVHTPEFDFEKDKANVATAIEKFGIKYPVVQDNQYATWQAYGNRYWPRKYLIDIDGYIVYDHIGEGAYDETEEKIQELLKERADVLGAQTIVGSGVVQPSAEPVGLTGSPEVYFGSLRNELLANGQPGVKGIQTFSAPVEAQKNKLYLGGTWDILQEYATNVTPGAKIVFRYNAAKVFMVLRSDKVVKVRVFVDDQPVVHPGSDVINGTLTVQESRLYRLVEDVVPGEHILELIIEEPGLETFTFTFG